MPLTKIRKSLNFFFCIIVLILNKVKSDSIINEGSYPLVYTLLDGKQFFIGENEIILYDADFQNSLNKYNLTGDLIITDLSESLKTAFCQFKESEGGYILLLIKDNLLLFDSNGKMLYKKENFYIILFYIFILCRIMSLYYCTFN